MLFMLFLPKAETIFMKGIYDNVRMVLTFGGAIFILFIWVRFVERPFHPLAFGREMDEKVFKRCVNRVLFISTPVILLLLMGSVKLQVQHITSTVIVGIVGSLVAFLIQGATEEIIIRGWLFRFFLLEVVYGLE